MATRFKFTIYRGQTKKNVTVAGGDTVGDDSLVLNCDCTSMTKGEALKAIDEIRRKIIETPWFPI